MNVKPVATAILLLAVACSCTSQVETVAVSSTLSARLTTADWRLYSAVYPTIPTEGYSITFRPDGLLITQNLHSKNWSLSDDHVLQLQPSLSFSFDPLKGVFVARPSGRPPFVIAPEGFDLVGYLATLEPLNDKEHR